MAVPFSNTKLRVPKGFQNILEGLAREVLRCQPENVFEFGATYFDTLLRNRTETGHDPAIHGARLEDRTYNNHAFKKGGIDPSDPQQQKAAVQIQTQYRQHSSQQAVEEMREEDAAVKIQAGFRGYIDRQEVKKRKSENGSAKDDAEEEEIDIDLNDPAVEDAAVKIQAQFKGFKARKQIQTKKTGAEEPTTEVQTDEAKDAVTEEVDIDLSDPEVSKAAIKIQSGFRGHLARQEIRQKKEQKGEAVSEQTSQSASANADADANQTVLTDTIVEEEEEEEIDIDLNDPEVEKAAVKIQASFKGFKSRKAQEQQAEESAAGGSTGEAAAPTAVPALEEDKPESPFPNAASDYEPKNKKAEDAAPAAAAPQEEEEVDIDLTDPEVEKAAIKIQAGFKGFKARKSLGGKDAGTEEAAPSKEGEDAVAAASEEPQEVKAEDEGQDQVEEVDIDLTNPEVEQAALKIQAGYKGFKTRRELKSKNAEKVEGEAVAESGVDNSTEGETGEKVAEGIVEETPEESSTQEVVVEETKQEVVVEEGGQEVSGEEQVEASEDNTQQQQASEEETTPAVAEEGKGENSETTGDNTQGEEEEGQKVTEQEN